MQLGAPVRHRCECQEKKKFELLGAIDFKRAGFWTAFKMQRNLEPNAQKKVSEWCHASTTPERHIGGLLEANPPAAVVVVVCSDQFCCCLSGCCSFAAGRKENSLPVGGLLHCFSLVALRWHRCRHARICFGCCCCYLWPFLRFHHFHCNNLSHLAISVCCGVFVMCKK